MPTKQELDKLPTTQLAVMCSKVAGDPEHYSPAVADEAAALKLEWTQLQTPPVPSLKEQQKKEAQLANLYTRMADFLGGIL